MAYVSIESGSTQVYVRPFSGDGKDSSPGAKWLISKTISGAPRWRGDGRQLFYTTDTLELMVVDVDTSKAFQAGTPRRLMAAPPPLVTVGWDASRGRQAFSVRDDAQRRPDAGVHGRLELGRGAARSRK